MHIEHCVFLSCFSASPESHEQDGEKLSRIIAMRRATASSDPAMAFRTLPYRKRRSLSALAKSPAAPIAAGLIRSKAACAFAALDAQNAQVLRGINHRRMPSFSIKFL
jgi:hypothetical protein